MTGHCLGPTHADWNRLLRLYSKINTSFPELLNNPEDIAGAQNFARILSEQKRKLVDAWENAALPQKIEQAKSLLLEAYPEDDVEHMSINAINSDIVGATYMDEIDVMLCGPIFDAYLGPALFMLSHEFQHRRQYRMVGKLDKGELENGSAEYYQARLYRANLGGGYLPLSQQISKITEIKMDGDALVQPVETQANRIAKIAIRGIDDSVAENFTRREAKFIKMSKWIAPVERTASFVRSFMP